MNYEMNNTTNKTMNYKIINKILRKNIYIILIPIIISILILYSQNVIKIVTLLTLIIVGSLSKIYKRFTSISIGFELITPITILIAFKFGIWSAIISSITMLFASAIISGKIDMNVNAIEIGIYSILAIITHILSGLPFLTLALSMMILRNLMLLPAAFLLLGRNPIQMLIVVSTNIIFNWIIISKFSYTLTSIL